MTATKSTYFGLDPIFLRCFNTIPPWFSIKAPQSWWNNKQNVVAYWETKDIFEFHSQKREEGQKFSKENLKCEVCVFEK